ncbi:MAG: Holliday junction resolvase RuvX [Opitutae bacterium]
MPNYLGIDYGTKRMGLAWADELLISLPAGAIAGVETEGCWEALAREVANRSITDFVVGYPVQMDGKIGVRAQEVDAFIQQLETRFGLPVHRVDERLTSVAAREAVGGKSKPKGADKTGRIDSTAACLILRDFLNA